MKTLVKLKFPDQEDFEEVWIRLDLFDPEETFELQGGESETTGLYRGIRVSLLNYNKLDQNK